jgi:antitoxin HicB
MRSQYSYPAWIDRDEEGRYQVRFADLPDALTDGADLAEALIEAVDCLSAALASRIIDGEEIPKPSPLAPGQRLVSPDPTIAMKVGLYAALRRRDMTVADLAYLLGMGDWHQAARLIDPTRSTKMTTLMTALDALHCEVEIAINDDFAPDDGPRSSAMSAVFTGSGTLHVDLQPVIQGGQGAAGRGTRSRLLLPVARQRSEAATAQSPPPRAEPGGRSRRKAKARSSD